MRTQQEIIDRINAVKDMDPLGFQTSDLLAYLEFEHAKQFIKSEITEEMWNEHRTSLKTPEENIKEYMSFAWGKANDCRGLSAGRSVEHMKAWLWLDGKDELADRLDDVYEFYGKPCLYLVCKEYGIDWKALDDDEWRNDEGDGGYTAAEAIKMKLGEEI